MKSPQNITIAFLMISAAILTALLVGMHVWDSPRAQAEVSVRHAQVPIIMTTGAYSKSMDLVYIIDIRTRRMNAYAYNQQSKRLMPLSTVVVDEVFRSIRPPR